MSVLIEYARANRHEAADAMRRSFVAAGFENVQVVYTGEEKVIMPSGETLNYGEAAAFLSSLETAIPVEFVTLPHGEGIEMPAYESAAAAGMDLRAAVTEPVTLAPGDFAMIPTGFNVAIPQGYEIQVRGRSGLAAKHGVCILHGVGTIDADYRGEIKAILINHGREPFTIQRGDRVAQAVIAPVVQARWVQVSKLCETARGEGGFGSTGRS